MNNSNIDTKKIIQMVAIIGILLVFVGVATRIRQNSQVTLSKYSGTQVSTDTSSSDENNEDSSSISDSETGSSSMSDSETNSSISDSDINSSKDQDTQISSSGSGNEINSSNSSMTQEEYDAFYYTDNDDNTSNVYIMYYIYYENKFQIQEGSLICDSDIAYELLDIFYNLYKNKYPLTALANDPAYIYSDDCTEEYEINELRANNVTYCKGKKIYINPLYNPCVSYDNEGNITVVPDSEYSCYEDRESNKGMYFIDREDLAYYLFTREGFLWGGDKSDTKDYSLFYKE